MHFGKSELANVNSDDEISHLKNNSRQVWLAHCKCS